MSAAHPNTPPEKHPIAHSTGGQAIQTIQGLYYVIGGLWVALLISMFQSVTLPHYDLSRMWAVRAVGLLVAGFGAALIASGRKKEGPFIGGSLAMGVALVIAVLDTVCLATGVLPPLVLVDAGVEIGFAGCWAVAILFWFNTAPNRLAAMTTPYTPPANG
ncbi:hypothetical protein [Frigoriglobus tundricola]|uniref:Uncharacterized protein n=1 Tax=Frigoriglobus tundricola TaxID=2774151 RepID=A0A6M5YTS7_9BACT|nr:hypothetical protein [Frigoriglobus tundricola]QJW97438.1 hypothetical protein FTUN_5012 [Frigoriglobus tundricola]